MQNAKEPENELVCLVKKRKIKKVILKMKQIYTKNI